MAGGIAVGRLFKCTSDHGLSGKVLRCVCFRMGVFSSYITNVFKGGDERFVKIYNRRGGKIINQEINIDGKRCYVTSFNTLQTNERFFSENLNFVDEGEGFEKKDYLLSASEKVPIILGHNYKKDVNLGETFTLNYLEKNLEFYVKGFFEEELANSHFLRTAGPHFPDSQGHIKRTALEIGRAERVPPC